MERTHYATGEKPKHKNNVPAKVSPLRTEVNTYHQKNIKDKKKHLSPDLADLVGGTRHSQAKINNNNKENSVPFWSARGGSAFSSTNNTHATAMGQAMPNIVE